MNTLIKISPLSLSSETVSTVNARELHSFLESKQEFANWIKDRIKQYDFTEGVDFLINLSKTPNGRPSIEYHITLDMAKELSMVERNAKGKQARQYFIAMEKKANQQDIKNLRPSVVRAGIRSREDLSFTKRDEAGRLLNWVMPDCDGNWNEHYALGQAWFGEVIELARHNPKQAFDALCYAGKEMIRFMETAHVQGFFHEMTRWSVCAILSHKELPQLPFDRE